ncbi:hypothetical protein OG21DRAFT_1401134 [Imleria badia]|nr:hypothetical protein OG21DRAFT_1401134 [Imleria badia]
MPADHRQTLNNYLQRTHRGDPRRYLTWETSREGSDHRPTWHAIAYLQGVEWGRGNGLSRGLAMEAAAKIVLIALGVLSQET